MHSPPELEPDEDPEDEPDELPELEPELEPDEELELPSHVTPVVLVVIDTPSTHFFVDTLQVPWHIPVTAPRQSRIRLLGL